MPTYVPLRSDVDRRQIDVIDYHALGPNVVNDSNDSLERLSLPRRAYG